MRRRLITGSSERRRDGGADRTGEDLNERFRKLRARVICGGGRSPANEAVRTHEDRAVARDPAVAQPSAARVEQVPVDVPDPDSIERQAGLCGQLTRRLAPRLAVLAGDQQKAAWLHEVLDRDPMPVLVLEPGVRERVPWP